MRSADIDDAVAERDVGDRPAPDVFATKPESLYILITSESRWRMLRTVLAVIVDEIRAVTAVAAQRGGRSATKKLMEDVAKFLVGGAHRGVALVGSSSTSGRCAGATSRS